MIIFLITALAFGQENDRQIRYQKETEIDFEALDVEGALVKPQGSLIVERDGANFNPLIELRMDWDKDMSRSVNLIK
tara:strand:- start:72 stop:302 length:231 start_codon:yes stop_codon:yes gene_type:complete